MKLTVNEEPVSAVVREGTSLNDLLDTLQNQGDFPDGEIVLDVAVDGRSVSAGELEADANPSVEEIGELAVRTGRVNQYAGGLLQDATDTLQVLIEATEEVSARFREQTAPEANQHLFRLFNAVQQFFGYLASIQNNCDLGNKPLESHPHVLQQLSDSLSRIETHQQAEEWSAVADCLQDELQPALRGMSGIIEAFQHSIEQ